MKNKFLLLTALLLAFGLAACSTGGNDTGSAGEGQKKGENAAQDPENGGAPSPGTEAGKNGEQPDSGDKGNNEDQNIPAKNRPATKTDTIALEGTPETFQFTLYDAPALGFSTYVVEDLVAEAASSGEGDMLTVYANFAGVKNEDAAVQIFSPAKGVKTTIDKQAKNAKEMLAKEGFSFPERSQDIPGKRYEWSELEFDIKKKIGNTDILGTVSLFQHGDRVYRVVIRYPQEFAEGFIPRVVKMFEDIVWYDEK